MKNKDDYLIRYKISRSVHDPREIASTPLPIVSMERKSEGLRQDPLARREMGRRIYAT